MWESKILEKDLEALLPVRELAAATRLVLLARRADDEVVDAALEALRPARALPWPAPAPLLRHAVAGILPADPSGEGARPGQRRAAALLGVSRAIRSVLEEVRRRFGAAPAPH